VAVRRDGAPQVRMHFDERWKAVYATRAPDEHKARRRPLEP